MVVLSALLQGLTLAAFANLAGGLAYVPLLLRSDRSRPLRDATRQARRRWTVINLVAASVMSVLVVWPSATPVVFADGRLLWMLPVRLLLLALLGLCVWRRRDESPRAVVLAAAFLFTQSALSRSAALADWVAPLLADWFHLALTSLWLGGVAMLALVLVPHAVADLALVPALEATLDRFSPMAMFCVLGLGLSGIAQSANFLHSFDELLSTDYGRALSVKLVLFVVLIGFGAFHQQVIIPKLRAWRLKRSQSSVAVSARHFAASLLAEAATSAVLLLAVGVMKALAL